jgi:hypothetical protein
VADVVLNGWSDKGTLTIGEATYRVRREALLSRTFVLEGAEGVLARAKSRGFFRPELLLHHAGRDYTLRARSIFRRTFVLLDGSREMGSLVPKNPFTRKAAADLPSDLPLPLRMFVVWLTVMSWRRAAAAGSAG